MQASRLFLETRKYLQQNDTVTYRLKRKELEQREENYQRNYADLRTALIEYK